MKYSEIIFKCDPFNEDISDVLSALLGDIGFDSFTIEDEKLLAYIPTKAFNNEELDNLLTNLPLNININYKIKEWEDKNWNEEWEKNYFSPIIIQDQCVIKSSFHKDVPDTRYTIIINPKMAFGTGHHQTTRLMLEEILKTDFIEKTVLDMGCGTGILAILAAMKGAKKITAIDIDEWAYDNLKENIEINNTKKIDIQIGDASLLNGKKFDVIIANINRNVLLADMEVYNKSLNENGILLLSGFYIQDVHILEKKAQKFDLQLEYFTEIDNWAAMKLNKHI